MQTPQFFGYGSLVNRRTHDYADLRPARLTGWRRAWRATPLRAVCFLTVVPDASAEIDGLIAAVPQTGLAALDARERAYDRVAVAHQITAHAPASGDVSVFAIGAGRHADPTADNPVLLSYIDTVIQGFLTEYQEDGVARFFDSTTGWDQAPILNDRARPTYPRAQNLSDDERDLVDAHLARTGARIFTA